jgi:hypothetical protein
MRRNQLKTKKQLTKEEVADIVKPSMKSASAGNRRESHVKTNVSKVIETGGNRSLAEEVKKKQK